MKKLIILILLTVISPVVMAGEEPYRVGIDGQPKYASREKNFQLLPEIKHVSQPRAQINPYYRKTYMWKQDVYQAGLWYYGYYSPDGLEFRFYRREYKGALSNFRSLYSVYYKEELRTSERRPVRTVYEAY